MAAMEAMAKKVLPNGMTFEWTGLSLEEVESGGKAAMLFALGLTFVYLTLAAQYESFVLPFIVLLAVPGALVGAIGGRTGGGVVYRRCLPNWVWVVVLGLTENTNLIC